MEPLVKGKLQNNESQNDQSQNDASKNGASCEKEMEKMCIPLRPHHGMCLAYFEGKGYSEGFTAHMQKVLELLTGKISESEKLPEVRLVTHTDEICRACPNNENGVCREAARVLGFDRGVLELCGFKDGQILEFGEFARLVQEKILSAGKRGEICGGCQWETICANRESRWRDSSIL